MAYVHTHLDDPGLGDAARRLRVINFATAQQWNWVTSAWVTPGASSFTDTTLALTEDVTVLGRYTATFTGFTFTGDVILEVYDVEVSPVELQDLATAASVDGLLYFNRTEVAAAKSNYLAPDPFLFKFTGRGQGTITAENEVTVIIGETVLVGFHFGRLAGDHKLAGATAVVSSGSPTGLVVTSPVAGNYDDGSNSHSHVNVRMEGVTAGDYEVECTVTTDSGMTLLGRGTVHVKA